MDKDLREKIVNECGPEVQTTIVRCPNCDWRVQTVSLNGMSPLQVMEATRSIPEAEDMEVGELGQIGKRELQRLKDEISRVPDVIHTSELSNVVQDRCRCSLENVDNQGLLFSDMGVEGGDRPLQEDGRDTFPLDRL